MARIDPHLQHEVDRLRGANGNLQALVVLDRGSVAGRRPDEVGAIVDDLVALVLPVIPEFLDSLLNNSGVGSATLNDS